MSDQEFLRKLHEHAVNNPDTCFYGGPIAGTCYNIGCCGCRCFDIRPGDKHGAKRDQVCRVTWLDKLRGRLVALFS